MVLLLFWLDPNVDSDDGGEDKGCRASKPRMDEYEPAGVLLLEESDEPAADWASSSKVGDIGIGCGRDAANSFGNE